MSALKLKALRARYEAQRLEALATLEVYMENAAGIGEHPQIIDEIDALVKKVDEAEGLLKTLGSIFKVEDQNKIEDQSKQEQSQPKDIK
jgi:hypothetical protein